MLFTSSFDTFAQAAQQAMAASAACCNMTVAPLHCIAHSGLILELLLTHNSSRLRFKVRFQTILIGTLAHKKHVCSG